MLNRLFPARAARLSYTALALASAFIMLPAQARALDFTPDATRYLSDPSYLPLKGQIYGITAGTYGHATSDTDNAAGARAFSERTNTESASQSLAYGILDDVTVRASESYEWSQRKLDFTGGDNSFRFRGFIDPSFGATWRALDQKRYPVNFDLTGSYAPDAFRARNAHTGSDGTVSLGGQEATGEAALSYVTRSFTVFTFGSATWQGERDSHEGGDATLHTDSDWRYEIGLNTQTRLTSLWSVNLGATETFNDDTDVRNGANGLTFNSNPGDTTGLSAALNYQIIPNRVVAGLTYNYNYTTDSKDNFSTDPALDEKVKNQDDNVVGARVMYTF